MDTKPEFNILQYKYFLQEYSELYKLAEDISRSFTQFQKHSKYDEQPFLSIFGRLAKITLFIEPGDIFSVLVISVVSAKELILPLQLLEFASQDNFSYTDVPNTNDFTIFPLPPQVFLKFRGSSLK